VRITRQCEHRDEQGRCHKMVHLPALPAPDTKVLCTTHFRKATPIGRPQRYGEPTVTAAVRMPISLYNTLTKRAQTDEESLSGLIVSLLRGNDAQETT
jgi:hypothetical protein